MIHNLLKILKSFLVDGEKNLIKQNILCLTTSDVQHKIGTAASHALCCLIN